MFKLAGYFMAFLQFDWSKASLSMDLPVFLPRHRRYRAAFYGVADLLVHTTQIEPYTALVLSRLKYVKVY